MGSYKRTKFDEEQQGNSSSLTCCGLCYLTQTQKRICYTVIAAPLIALLVLVSVILGLTFTVEEKFQIEKLSEEPVDFLNPSAEEAIGEYLLYTPVFSSDDLFRLGTEAWTEYSNPYSFME